MFLPKGNSLADNPGGCHDQVELGTVGIVKEWDFFPFCLFFCLCCGKLDKRGHWLLGSPLPGRTQNWEI